MTRDEPTNEPRDSAHTDAANESPSELVAPAAEFSLPTEQTVTPRVLPIPNHGLTGLREALSFLTFEASGVRFGMQLGVCLLMFFLIDSAASSAQVFGEWRSFISWSVACVFVAAVDHALFLPALRAFHRACSLDSFGNSAAALKTLREIAPDRDRLIVLSPAKYQLCRALFLSNSQDYGEARKELEVARSFGASPHDIAVLSASMHAAQGQFDTSRSELAEVAELYGSSPGVKLEESFVFYNERKDLRAARKGFEEVLKMPETSLITGGSTHAVARAFREVCRLWTGYAEEAIGALTRECEVLTAAYSSNELMRPTLARLYLERGYYLATHSEPEAALSDLRLAQLLCRQPQLSALVERLQGELEWRHKRKNP